MMGAGDLRERVRFLSRPLDANGRAVGEHELRLSRWAKVIYPDGSEVALQGRLQGLQPATILIRDGRAAREIATDWRAEIQRLGAVYNVKAISPAAEPGFWKITAVALGEQG